MRLNTKHSKKPANAYDLSLDHNKCSYSHNTKQNTLQMFFLNRKILCKFSDVEKNAKKKNASKKTTEFISVALMRRSSIFCILLRLNIWRFKHHQEQPELCCTLTNGDLSGAPLPGAALLSLTNFIVPAACYASREKKLIKYMR